MKPKLNKKLAFWLLLLVSVFIFAGCGGATDTETEETTDTAAVDDAAESETETATETETAADSEEEAADAPADAESSGDGFVLAPRIAEKVANGEPLVLRVSYHDVSNEFAPFINMGVEQAAAEFGVDVEMVGPVSPDADAQIAELENLVAAGIDGLAISSVSSDALAPVIERLIAEGIPVVTYNTDNPDSGRLAFAGQDLEQSGYEAAIVLADLMNGEGDILITTLDAAAQWSIDRETGARRGFEEYPGINVLQTVNTGTEPQEIYASIENAMLANPTVTGILSLECCSVSPAGEYVKRNGLTGEVTVVGFDELPTTLQLIDEGVIAASLSQAPERQSYEAVRMLLDVLNGETVSDVDTGIAVIDQSNLDVYMQGGEDTTAAADDSGFVLAPQIAEKIANGEPLVLRVSYHDVSNEFAPFINMGVEQAAAEFGVDVEMVGPVSPDADAQIAELENLVAAGIDGLAISSVSSDALAPVIERLIAEGIPVVTYNTDNPDSGRLAFAGQDLEQSGYEAAIVLADLMNGEGDILITTLDAAAQWSIDRETGARRGFEEYPGINVLQTVNTGTEPQEIYASIENAMLANPTVTGILSLECCSVSPAGEYVKRNGLTGEVTVVGFDELPTTLQLIDEGVIAASLSQAPERQSYEAVRMLLDVLNGEAVSDVDTGIAVIDQSNLDIYMQDN